MSALPAFPCLLDDDCIPCLIMMGIARGARPRAAVATAAPHHASTNADYVYSRDVRVPHSVIAITPSSYVCISSLLLMVTVTLILNIGKSASSCPASK
jgi:hypothetical protein